MATGYSKTKSEQESVLSDLLSRATHIGLLVNTDNAENGTAIESASSGYARQSISWSAISSLSPTGSYATNTNTLEWPPGFGGFGSAPGIGLSGIGLYDAAIGGNLLRYVILAPVFLYGYARIAAGALQVIED